MASITVPPVPISPRDDAIQLYRAFKGIGCDSAAVVNILAHRDSTQRALLQQEYRTMYSEDLLKRLSKELSGKLETAVLLWMHDPAGRDAIVLRQAFTGDFINLEAATEVICSRTPSQIQTIKQLYFSMFGAHLEHDIARQTSGDHEKLLVAYVSKPRYEGLEVDRQMAEKDAKALFKAGEKKLGTDEKTFIHIFSERSRAHLVAVSYAYHSMYGSSLKKAVKSETSGQFEHALLAILHCAENPAKYFAKVLHKAMKGLGTNDSTLIRVIVTRTEIDMQYIKAEYCKKYKKTLNDAVHSETSGHLYLKSDVYGFGVVLLEILTGQRVLDTSRPAGKHNLVEWVKPFLTKKDQVKKIIDPQIKHDCPPEGAFQTAALVRRCLQPEPKVRPSMQEVLEMLEEISVIKMKPKRS